MTQSMPTWQRFWQPQGTFPQLDFDGFLADPLHTSFFPASVVGFDSLKNYPCLILLGEPGMGKTTAMRQEFETERLASPHAFHLFHNLGQFTTDIGLIQGVFESPGYLAWVHGNGPLYLYLDSLDECLLRVDTVATILAEQLAHAPLKRLSIRIASRSAQWPVYLETKLRDLFNDAVGVFELAPLRRVDVEGAAERAQLDVSSFIEALSKQGTVPLALRPVTLNFLLNTYRRNDAKLNRYELYLEGCRILCEENSAARLASPQLPKPNRNRRLEAAAEIAAVAVFCRKSAIWRGPDLGTANDSELLLQDLTAQESGPSSDDRANLFEDVLGSRLFMRLDANRYAFAHHTYAEFLAAHFVKHRNLSTDQILSLIAHAGDHEGRIVPQLSETAAWIAQANPLIFQKLIATDPGVILRGDIDAASHDDKRSIVRELLGAVDAGLLFDDSSLRDQYSKLDYPTIAEELKPFIVARSKEIVTRRAAIDIAEQCPGARSLQGLLVDIALDTSETHQIREQAAHAVAKMGDLAALKALVGLVTDADPNDPDDELKGIAMKALWPRLVDSATLFCALTLPKRQSLYGAYYSFISSTLVSGLTGLDLAPALNWITTLPRRHDLPLPFRRAMDRTFEIAFEHLDSPDILHKLLPAILSRFRTYDELVEQNHRGEMPAELARNDVGRMNLLMALAATVEPGSHEATALVHGASRLAVPQDIPVIVRSLRQVPDRPGARTLAHVVQLLFYISCTHLDDILDAIPLVPALRDQFGSALDAVLVDSEVGRNLRAEWLKQKRMFASPKEQILSPPPAERVRSLLAGLEAGSLDCWWRLNLEMTLEPTSTRYGDEFELDLRELPGWRSANIETRRRIVAGARVYLLGTDDKRHEWLGKQILFRPAAAGYRALVLLENEDPGFIRSVGANTWRAWAGAVSEFARQGTNEGGKTDIVLIRSAYSHAAEDMIAAVRVLIDAENERGAALYALYRFEPCWDERLGAALLAKAGDSHLKPAALRDMLQALLKHQVNGADRFAREVVFRSDRTDTIATQRAQFAASMLLIYSPAEAWPYLWPLMSAEPDFGKNVIELVAHCAGDRSGTHFVRQLTENALADLYIWLERNYPSSSDPKHEGMHAVGPREAVAEVRQDVLMELQQRGTIAARREVARIVKTLSHVPWLKWALVRARQRTLEMTWTPPKPADIIRLSSDSHARLVEGPTQLLDLVQESLKRLNESLQGETPASPDCWDSYRPKDEEALSNYIKRHLERDLAGRGIVVNREVEIRRGEGLPGERPDIIVDAVSKEQQSRAFDVVSVVVEVKGIWNSEVETAMETQLRGRYLRDNPNRHGLYVVVSPICKAWDTGDPRYVRAKKWNMARAEKFFARQAEALSGEGFTLRASVINIGLR
jgi:hypothetical protein